MLDVCKMFTAAWAEQWSELVALQKAAGIEAAVMPATDAPQAPARNSALEAGLDASQAEDEQLVQRWYALPMETLEPSASASPHRTRARLC